MKHRTIVLGLALAACAVRPAGLVAPPAVRADRPPATAGNPLLEPWPGPHGGLPPFDRVRVEHFVPAFARAMAETRHETAAIATATTPPTFENTVAALEDAGRTFDRV